MCLISKIKSGVPGGLVWDYRVSHNYVHDLFTLCQVVNVYQPPPPFNFVGFIHVEL